MVEIGQHFVETKKKNHKRLERALVVLSYLCSSFRPNVPFFVSCDEDFC